MPEVFDLAKTPWVQPQHASAEALAELVRRCPSGALTFRRKDGGSDESATPGVDVVLAEDGPLYVSGDLRLVGPDGTELTEALTRVALCRCGESDNKPFCDNSHNAAGFRS